MKTAAKSTPHWPTIAIVGVGLIGGSLGLAVTARRLAARVIGVGRSAGSLAEARRRDSELEADSSLGISPDEFRRAVLSSRRQ